MLVKDLVLVYNLALLSPVKEKDKVEWERVPRIVRCAERVPDMRAERISFIDSDPDWSRSNPLSLNITPIAPGSDSISASDLTTDEFSDRSGDIANFGLGLLIPVGWRELLSLRGLLRLEAPWLAVKPGSSPLNKTLLPVPDVNE
mmetsp:Transcript_18249/g.42703  ORF Transcript_18249/g.42703 Transcript_18249/m.42703 type:complete len:145 (-) Transcript_18249:374-808(-)